MRFKADAKLNKQLVSLRESFRNQLLPLTIRHAASQVLAYKHLKLFDGRINQASDLSILPIIDKRLMLKTVEAYREQNTPTSLIQHTTGTSGHKLIIHRGTAEIDFIKQFFTHVYTDGVLAQPLCITFNVDVHGEPTPIPYPGSVLQFDIFDAEWRLKAKRLASEPWTFTRDKQSPAVLTGLEPQLRVFTTILLESDYNFAQSSIRSIYSTGDLITSRLRRWYESIWGVPLFDRYSMSEIFGGASQCNYCRFWHLDPYVIGEVVDIGTRTNISEGLGVLVLTSLFPFVQKQPFIRYWTGDVVEVHTNCPVDSLGFVFKGRLARCVIQKQHSASVPLVLAADVYDILDEFPDIARTRMFESVGGLSDHSSLGHLKLELSLDESMDVSQCVLRIEMRYPSYMFPERAKSVIREIRNLILERHLNLATQVESGMMVFRVEAVLPGTLDGFRPATIEEAATELTNGAD